VKKNMLPLIAAREWITSPAAGDGFLQQLEPRTLLSGFVGYAANAAFNFEQFAHDLQTPPEVSGAHFGGVVAALGDIDTDGVNDFAVAAPGSMGMDGRWSGDAGQVFLFSGQTFTLIRVLTDGGPGFGSAMAALGDVNSDGVPDLAVGSPSADTNSDLTLDYFGRVSVYSGADGSVLWSQQGVSRLDEFGWAIAAAGDMDNDGRMDLIVGVPGAGGDDFTPGAGAVSILSGVDGASLAFFAGETAGDRFGHAVDGGVDAPTDAADEAGDGFFDLFVGAPGYNAGAGRAYVYSGGDFSLRTTFDGLAGDEAGTAVAILGVGALHPGAGLRYAVGSPGRNADTGTVRLFPVSGDEQLVGQTLEAGARFGSRITRLDVHDQALGNPFFTVTAPGSATGNRLFTYFNTSIDSGVHTGADVADSSSLAALGDIDGDGVLDFIVGLDGGLGTARVLPSALVFGGLLAPDIVAASDDGMNFILDSLDDPRYAFTEFDDRAYVVINGELMTMSSVPGLPPGGRLVSVNNAGLFVGVHDDQTVGGFYTRDSIFFLYNGESISLSDAITSYDGVQPTGLFPFLLSNNGDAVFRGYVAGSDQVTSDGVVRTFLFRGGVLVEHTDYLIRDANDAGQLLIQNTGVENSFILNPDGSSVEIVGFRTFSQGQKLGDDGSVVGVVPGADNEEIGVWRDGQITLLTEALPRPVGQTPFWLINDVDDAGRILARMAWSDGESTPSYFGLTYLYTPENGFQRLIESEDADAGSPGQGYSSATLLNSGAIRTDGSLLQPIDDLGVPGAHNSILTSATSGGSGLVITAVNQNGEAILFRRDGVRFIGDTLDVGSDLGGVASVVTYIDTRDGGAYAVVRTDQSVLVWFRQNSDGLYTDGVVLDLGSVTPIASALAVYTSTDGRAHIAGVSADGEVVIYYQTNLSAPESLDNWAYNNLSADHLVSQGNPVPTFDAETLLAPYVTPWGGMNLAGVNTTGQIEVVWWAPGNVYWNYDNLSAQAGTPALHDGIVAFVGSWGGLHLAGVDSGGRLHTTWWAPGLSSWVQNDLTTEVGGAVLQGGSLTAYVTDWNGLNIAGINDDTGEAVVYWWTPTTDGWISETLDLGADSPVLIGSLVSAVRGNNLNIFASAEDGRMLRLFWYPSQGSEWMTEQVGASVG